MKTKMEEAQVVAQLVELSRIDPSPLNANSMTEQAFAGLVADMKQHGPTGINPIDIYEPNSKVGGVQYTVADGNHRLQAAKSLGWQSIPARILGRKSDTDAMLYAWHKNAERGTLDPFMEALVFRKVLDTTKQTESQLAVELGCDRTLISHRLSLLQIKQDVRDRLRETKLTASHMELLATMQPGAQELAAKELLDVKEVATGGQVPTVRAFADAMERVKSEYRTQEQLKAALEKSVHKKCPTCGQLPNDISYLKLPYVECKNYHHWNLNDGLTREQHDKQRQGPPDRERGQQSMKPKNPSALRTEYTVQDFEAAFSRYVLVHAADFDSVSDVRISGEKDGKHRTMYLNVCGSFVSLHDEIGKVRFVAEPKDYASDDLKKFKTVVSGPSSELTPAKMKELQKDVDAFMTKYGDRRKKGPGRPREDASK